MKGRTQRILTLGLAAALTATLASVTPALADKNESRYRGQTVSERHPGKNNKKAKRFRRQDRVIQYAKYHKVRHRDLRTVRFETLPRARFVVVRPRATRYFVSYGPRYVMVRPVPYWVAPPYRRGIVARIGFGNGDFGMSLCLADVEPEFGCPFCHAHFPRYRAWDRHVMSCKHAAWRGRMITARWTPAERELFRQRALDAYWDDYHG